MNISWYQLIYNIFVTSNCYIDKYVCMTSMNVFKNEMYEYMSITYNYLIFFLLPC